MASFDLSSDPGPKLSRAQQRGGRSETQHPEKSLSPAMPCSSSISPEDYTKPFMSFLTENPTVFHTVDYFAKSLESHGFSRLSERDVWNHKLKKGGKYYVERNGSSMVAFVVGKEYEVGNGAGIIAGHIDALTARRMYLVRLPARILG